MKYSQCPECKNKGFYIPAADQTLLICKYCGHTASSSLVIEVYRGYTLTVEFKKLGTEGEERYEGLAKKNHASDLHAYYMLGPDEALARLKRNIDYYEGIEDVESKSNEQLANYLVDDVVSDLKIFLTDSQARFLLEIADRLRKVGELPY